MRKQRETGFTGFSKCARFAHGRITGTDYEAVLIPEVDAKLTRHHDIKCYYEVAADASFDVGAVWDDAKIGIEHMTRWARVAVVTDIEWLRNATNAFRFLMPGKVRVFESAQASEARRWIAS
ncbi:MAG TPA: STAS/SEC14 domain-containing protein [Candidatus Aquilonibacter sp.]|nr:STAS/SEC14 domain-containing protein [Candidatus Aquilonibacter sp.]